jgi:DNA-binding XRE family transcriptional regulator
MSPRSPHIKWSVNVDRIERARVLNAWTRRHLAAVAHVDPKTLTDMCTGRRRPTFGTVQAICVALGLTVADVIVFEEGLASTYRGRLS